MIRASSTRCQGSSLTLRIWQEPLKLGHQIFQTHARELGRAGHACLNEFFLQCGRDVSTSDSNRDIQDIIWKIFDCGVDIALVDNMVKMVVVKQTRKDIEIN